jgi:hypothetical protein
MPPSLKTFFIALALCVIAAGNAAAQTDQTGVRTCRDAVRDHARLQGVMVHMSALSSAKSSLWKGYRPESANYIFIVPGPEKKPCAALWRAGAVTAVFELSTEPELSTALYGFVFPDDAANKGVLSSFRQPPELRRQLEALGVQQAILLPIDGDQRLKLTLSSQELFDMAVHEGFHAYAQFPTWGNFDSPHRWPAWSTPQPNRLVLATRCYGSSDPLEPRLTEERNALVRAAMTAVTGGPVETICGDAKAFIAERQSRWSKLASISVPAEAGNKEMSCGEAEAIMELNEGVADFVSWLTAHQIGVVQDEQLRRRFTAGLRDLSYVTASMQLVVLRRLLEDGFLDATSRVSTSTSWDSGSIFSILEAQVSGRCH